MADQWFYLQQWARKRAEQQLLLDGLEEGEGDGKPGDGDGEQHSDEEQIDGDTGTVCGTEETNETSSKPPDSLH